MDALPVRRQLPRHSAEKMRGRMGLAHAGQDQVAAPAAISCRCALRTAGDHPIYRTDRASRPVGVGASSDWVANGLSPINGDHVTKQSARHARTIAARHNNLLFYLTERGTAIGDRRVSCYSAPLASSDLNDCDSSPPAMIASTPQA